MNENMNLIVMLTHNDKTVENAYDIFDYDLILKELIAYKGVV